LLNIERPEFDKQLAILCAGLDVPCTDERKEAYWKGLNRMSLPLFTRAVEQILSEENWTKVPARPNMGSLPPSSGASCHAS